VTQFGSNFNPVQNFANGRVKITGTTLPPDGATPLFRGVVLQQGELVASGQAAGLKDWDVELPGFDPHLAALAIGTEIYAFEDREPDSPAFATFTWAQKINFTT